MHAMEFFLDTGGFFSEEGRGHLLYQPGVIPPGRDGWTSVSNSDLYPRGVDVFVLPPGQLSPMSDAADALPALSVDYRDLVQGSVVVDHVVENTPEFRCRKLDSSPEGLSIFLFFCKVYVCGRFVVSICCVAQSFACQSVNKLANCK